jgi:Domain of unknown function (DUF4160)
MGSVGGLSNSAGSTADYKLIDIGIPFALVHILHYKGIMVTVFREARWKIAIYANDHGIPHFHVEGPDFRCSVAIESNSVIIGTVPPKILREALVWSHNNRSELMQKWQELNR